MAESIQIIGLKELQAAVNRSPRTVIYETKNFMSRGLKVYKSGIINNPWRMGSNGGGAPVSHQGKGQKRSAGGNLRDTHETVIDAFTAYIRPTATYAKYVHGIAGIPRKRSYQLRPWLDFVKADKDSEIQILYGKLLANITADLAK